MRRRSKGCGHRWETTKLVDFSCLALASAATYWQPQYTRLVWFRWSQDKAQVKWSLSWHVKRTSGGEWTDEKGAFLLLSSYSSSCLSKHEEILATSPKPAQFQFTFDRPDIWLKKWVAVYCNLNCIMLYEFNRIKIWYWRAFWAIFQLLYFLINFLHSRVCAFSKLSF